MMTNKSHNLSPSQNNEQLWHVFVPKLYWVLRHGYNLRDFRGDCLAGLTVAIVALPLAMALAIASGTSPEKGLHTAIIAGFLISFLGGSRVQIGGPTAAFIPIVFSVIAQHGYGGMILCTLLAGLMLIAAGFLRLGALMKFMPKPVITGFTAGIAVSIFSSQVKDLLGLHLDKVPADFIPRWQSYWQHIDSINPWAVGLVFISVFIILTIRRINPSLPSMLTAVVIATLASTVFILPVETIGSRFPQGIPTTLPTFEIPSISFAHLQELLPSAFTIAFLAGVESLLSAVVADGMIGGRHRSNTELIAQGWANCASALFGGLPATGAIARTATNVRAGGRTPIAGILHAIFLLLFMLLLAPLMSYIPLAALAAVLLIVAWNMAEIEHFKHLLKGPFGDRVVLLLTFVLTAVFDLTIAIEVGVVLAAFLFAHRMTEVVEVNQNLSANDDDQLSVTIDQRADLPKGVEVFQIAGPLFFAVADRLDHVLDQYFEPPEVLILRLRLVPMMDTSGVAAFKQFLDRAHRMHIRVILSGLQKQPKTILEQMHILNHAALCALVSDFSLAVPKAREIMGLT
jgi:SulP family sulfate permease